MGLDGVGRCRDSALVSRVWRGLNDMSVGFPGIKTTGDV